MVLPGSAAPAVGSGTGIGSAILGGLGSAAGVLVGWGWPAEMGNGELPDDNVIPFPGNEEVCPPDDDIDCDEWVMLLNMEFAQISAFKRAGGDTTLAEIQHNQSVDLLCNDPDCGYLCDKANRF